MSVCNFLEESLLRHALGISSYTSPRIWLGISTTAPNESGGNWTELSGTTRQPIAFNAAEKKQTMPTGARIRNSTNAYFGPAPSPSGWMGMRYWGLFEAKTGGNLLAFSGTAIMLSIAAGKYHRLAPRDLTIDLDSTSWTTFLLSSLLSRAFASGEFEAPSVYVALCTSVPPVTQEDASSMNELSGGNYSRAACSAWNTVTQVFDAAKTSNSANVDYAQANADWSYVMGVALCNASSGGKLLAAQSGLGDVNNGDTARFTPGTIAMSIGS